MKKFLLLAFMAIYAFGAKAGLSINVNSGQPQNVQSGTINQTVLNFQVTNDWSTGEDEQINFMRFAFTGNLPWNVFSNIALYDGNGFQIGPLASVNTQGQTLFYFGSSLLIPPGQTANFSLHADITDMACQGGCYQVGIIHLTATGISSGNQIQGVGYAYGPSVCITNTLTNIGIDSIPNLICQYQSFRPVAHYDQQIPCSPHIVEDWNFGWGCSIVNWDGPNALPAIQYNSAGSFEIWLTLTDTLTGYFQQFHQSIHVYPIAQANVAMPLGTQLNCNIDTLSFTANVDQNGIFEWLLNGDSLSTSQTIIVTQPGNYALSVISSDGCASPWGGQNFNVTVDSFRIQIADNFSTALDSAWLCPGQNLGLNVSVGNTNTWPIIWNWNNGNMSQWINVQTPGLYIVTATNNLGCTEIDSVYVSERNVTQPIITADGPTAFCVGGSVGLHATPGYQNYQWNNVYPSNGESVTAHYGGTVNVFATDTNGCNSFSNEIMITVSYGPQQPTVTPLGCELISSAVSGNQWFVNGVALSDTSQIITPSVSGLFTVTVFDSLGCSSSSAQAPFQVQNLSVITAEGSMQFCEGGSVFLTVSPGSNFLWSNGETTQSILVTTSGTYTVTVTNGNCIQQASPVTVIVDSCGATGISEVEAKTNVHLFPNPAQHIVTITSPENFSDVIVTDMTGREVIKTQSADNNTTFNVAELPAGVYFVSGKSGEGTFSKKFVKQ